MSESSGGPGGPGGFEPFQALDSLATDRAGGELLGAGAEVMAAEAISTDVTAAIAGRSTWQQSVDRLRHDRTATVMAGVIVVIVLLAIFAPVVAHLVGHQPDTQYRSTGLTPDGLPKGPNGTFWMGTDDLGRDLMVRIVYGARISLLVSVVSTALTIMMGVAFGLVAGYYGGAVDSLLSRLTDLVLSFPFLLFVIAMASLVGPSLLLLILAISLFSWASVARVVRGLVLSLRRQEFVEAAISMGARGPRIMFVELLPNLMAPIIVYTTLLIPSFVVLEATLSFLGLGVPPPTPTWGGMLNDSVSYYRQAWWFVFFPGAALLLTTVAFNLLGDSVRDAFDPRGSTTRTR